LEALAKKFDLDKDSIWRHWRNHVSAEMKAAYLAGPLQLEELAQKAADTGGSVLDHLQAVRVVLMSHLSNATEGGDGRTAALVAGKLTSVLEVIAKISGELGDLARSTTFHITNNVALIESPAFARVQAAILRALAPHSAARMAVVEALQELDAETPGATGARLVESKPAPMVIDIAPVASVAPPPY
jgi:hypothetical protein